MDNNRKILQILEALKNQPADVLNKILGNTYVLPGEFDDVVKEFESFDEVEFIREKLEDFDYDKIRDMMDALGYKIVNTRNAEQIRTMLEEALGL